MRLTHSRPTRTTFSAERHQVLLGVNRWDWVQPGYDLNVPASRQWSRCSLGFWDDQSTACWPSYVQKVMINCEAVKPGRSTSDQGPQASIHATRPLTKTSNCGMVRMAGLIVACQIRASLVELCKGSYVKTLLLRLCMHPALHPFSAYTDHLQRREAPGATGCQ